MNFTKNKAPEMRQTIAKGKKWNIWRMCPTESDWPPRPAILARTDKTSREAILKMLTSSPSDSRLSVMEHLQGMLALLQITEAVVSPATKEEIFKAAVLVQKRFQGVKRTWSDVLDDEDDEETDDEVDTDIPDKLPRSEIVKAKGNSRAYYSEFCKSAYARARQNISSKQAASHKQSLTNVNRNKSKLDNNRQQAAKVKPRKESWDKYTGVKKKKEATKPQAVKPEPTRCASITYAESTRSNKVPLYSITVTVQNDEKPQSIDLSRKHAATDNKTEPVEPEGQIPPYRKSRDDHVVPDTKLEQTSEVGTTALWDIGARLKLLREEAEQTDRSPREKAEEISREVAENSSIKKHENSEKSSREEAENSEKSPREEAENSEKTSREEAEEISREVAENSSIKEHENSEKSSREEAENSEKIYREEAENSEKTSREETENSEKSSREEAENSEKTYTGVAENSEKISREETENSEKSSREEAENSEKTYREEAENSEKISREETENSEKSSREEAENSEKIYTEVAEKSSSEEAEMSSREEQAKSGETPMISTQKVEQSQNASERPSVTIQPLPIQASQAADFVPPYRKRKSEQNNLQPQDVNQASNRIVLLHSQEKRARKADAHEGQTFQTNGQNDLRRKLQVRRKPTDLSGERPTDAGEAAKNTEHSAHRNIQQQDSASSTVAKQSLSQWIRQPSNRPRKISPLAIPTPTQSAFLRPQDKWFKDEGCEQSTSGSRSGPRSASLRPYSMKWDNRNNNYSKKSGPGWGRPQDKW